MNFPLFTFVQAAQVGSYCGVLKTIVTSLGSLHYASIGLLHLLRVRAVYLDRPWVIRSFVLIWMISSGTSIAIGPYVLNGAPVAGDSCMHTEFNATLQQISFAINTIQGTCVVLATSSSLVMSPLDFPFTKDMGFVEKVKTSVMAKDLPTFSKSLLRHSQGYYLLLLCVNLTTAIGISIHKIPLAYRVAMLIATHAVLHCAACSIFRNVGKAKYITQELINDLPLSFRRDHSQDSSQQEVGSESQENSCGQESTPKEVQKDAQGRD
ncbi:hypothetical protein PM082_012351 [Marasmius tenuissimus]|nr:hypothetical protein PM082_012351 [Marasmius tenuissimus]